jgi:hypothetical protein
VAKEKAEGLLVPGKREFLLDAPEDKRGAALQSQAVGDEAPQTRVALEVLGRLRPRGNYLAKA